MKNNVRKSWNNNPALPVCAIECKLCKIAHFIVKSIRRLHNWHSKIDIALFSMFHHSALLMTSLGNLALYYFFNGPFNTYQTQSVDIWYSWSNLTLNKKNSDYFFTGVYILIYCVCILWSVLGNNYSYFNILRRIRRNRRYRQKIPIYIAS